MRRQTVASAVFVVTSALAAASIAAAPDISGTWSTPFAVHASGLGMTAGVTQWAPLSRGDPANLTPLTLKQLGDLADLSVRTHNGVPIFGAPLPTDPPFTAAGQAAFAAIDRKAVLARDVACFPTNLLARVGLGPVQIVEGKSSIAMINEAGLGRTVFLDGRSEANALPQWSGHSVGHWQGPVLKVVTTAIRGGVFGMPFVNFPMSDDAVLEEEYRLRADGKLVLRETLNDPAYYKEPLVRMAYLDRVKDEVTDYTCTEGKDDMIEMVSKPPTS